MPQVPVPHGVTSTPPGLNSKPGTPPHFHFVPETARATADASTSAGLGLFRRQPIVPIDFDSGHVGVPADPSFHALRSQYAAALAPSGGPCRLRGGWSAP